MLKVYSNFIDAKYFLDSLETRPNAEELKALSLSIFNDYMPTIEQLSENEYNILSILEPNQLFNLHTWALQNHDKFSCILTWGKDILDTCDNATFFAFGVSWIDKPYVEIMATKKKTFEVSYLCGAKKMIEGHYLRHRLFNRGDEIKIPKKWFYTLPDYSPAEGRILGDLMQKKVVWDDSMYSICIENSSNYNYHTEKIIDAFLTKTVPIYWGCKNIGDFYDINGIIYCQDENEIIEKVNTLTEQDYYNCMYAINKNYETAKYYADIYTRYWDMVSSIMGLG